MSGFASFRIVVLALLILLSGCASVMNKVTSRFSTNLTNAILDQDDVATVKDGVPAYLLLIDGLLAGDPENADLLLAASKLYGAYNSGFVDDAERGQRLAERAFSYAKLALCLQKKELCSKVDMPFEQFSGAANKITFKEIPVVYGFAASWAGKIQANTADWNAIADIPKVQLLLERIVALEPQYDHGGPDMYLGVLNSIRPASLGGKPEQGKAYFDKALELSGGKNQMVRVLYAQHYARLMFDQELHDRLLNEVLAADLVEPQLTLINTLARQRAKKLLDSSKDYF